MNTHGHESIAIEVGYNFLRKLFDPQLTNIGETSREGYETLEVFERNVKKVCRKKGLNPSDKIECLGNYFQTLYEVREDFFGTFYLGNWLSDVSQTIDPVIIRNFEEKIDDFFNELESSLLLLL